MVILQFRKFFFNYVSLMYTDTWHTLHVEQALIWCSSCVPEELVKKKKKNISVRNNGIGRG